MSDKYYTIRLGNKYVRLVLQEHWNSNRRKWMDYLELMDESRPI
ncbi:MAG: hypothetical protein ACW98I_12985 [Candidatus Hodarchaeales archaeon]|jgi:hypothetical protein